DFVKLAASCRDRNYVNFMMCMTFSGFPKLNPGERQIPFEVQKSPIVEGLGLLEHSQSNTPETMKQVAQILSSSKSVIVGSVRMGYGHHRIAYSALTWALELGGKPFLLDILSPDCVEAAVVRNMDKQYSRMSRIASNLGGVIDAMWGKMMLQGDANALRCCLALSQKIRGIMAAFPKDVPVISSHPIVGNMAVACGFKNVINLIFDNYPQYFVLVPGAINLVQSPSYFDKLLDMGCPSSSLRLAGHWVSRLVEDRTFLTFAARLSRLEKKLPRRFLIAVGGAGAQRAFLEGLLQGIADLLREKRALTDDLALSLDWTEVTTNEGTVELCKKEALAKLEEPADWKAVTLFRFDSHFAAFRCTDLVIRMVDVLVTKPSELAFFPVPKLHIRRVGAHEAHSAVRAQELGDGTVECREVSHAVSKLHQLIEPDSALFRLMNDCIIKAAETNVYDGSKVACEIAFGLNEKTAEKTGKKTELIPKEAKEKVLVAA
ncbi:CBL-interacting protein kinase 28, partial [Durusdinium trenchii]